MTVICHLCSEKRSNRDCLMNDDKSICYFCLTYYKANNNKKYPKALRNCHVYTLMLTNPKKNHYRFVEWGRAKEMKKVLLVVFSDETRSQYSPKLYKYLMNESKQSLAHLSSTLKDKIIEREQEIPCNTFDEYKKWCRSYQPKE